MAWAVISLPKAQGGLGIIDPVNQSRALLAKLVVRVLQPGTEKWKQLLRYRMALCSPVIGGPWQPNIRWIFNKTLNIRQSKSWENNFITGIWRAWSQIRLGLRLEELASNEELQRQPITWNPRFIMASGHMLGAHTGLAWGPLTDGPGKSLGNWQGFLDRGIEDRANMLRHLRGGLTMFEEVQEVLNTQVLTLKLALNRWLGMFTDQEKIVGIIGRTTTNEMRYFLPNDEGLLSEVGSVPEQGRSIKHMGVRIVAYSGQHWYFDPLPEKITMLWKVWVWEARPIIRHQWDLGEYKWIDPYRQRNMDGISFYNYSVKLGRRILAHAREAHACPLHFGMIMGYLKNFLGFFGSGFGPGSKIARSLLFNGSSSIELQLSVNGWAKQEDPRTVPIVDRSWNRNVIAFGNVRRQDKCGLELFVWFNDTVRTVIFIGVR